jgi:opacity protein-like surface antigen
MKKLVILSALIIFIYSAASSQEADSIQKSVKKEKSDEYMTLFGHSKPGGVYGAFSTGYSQIGGEHAVMFGGRFEWIAAQSFGFGFGGKGFINEYHYEPSIDKEVFLTGGYGGLYIEPILMPRFPVHLAFPVLLGGGGVSYVTKDQEFDENFIEESEAILVAEPSAELELNITRHFRLAFGASYLFTTPFDIGSAEPPLASSKSLEGWNFNITFKFGRF